MLRRPANGLLALALMALGMLAARSVDAQVPPPQPPGNNASLPPADSSGQMSTIPRSTAFFIASVEIGVIVAAIVVGIVLPTRPSPPTPSPSGPTAIPADPKRPAPSSIPV